MILYFSSLKTCLFSCRPQITKFRPYKKNISKYKNSNYNINESKETANIAIKNQHILKLATVQVTTVSSNQTARISWKIQCVNNNHWSSISGIITNSIELHLKKGVCMQNSRMLKADANIIYFWKKRSFYVDQV